MQFNIALIYSLHSFETLLGTPLQSRPSWLDISLVMAKLQAEKQT